jgi:DNA-binding MarR family transcriptional regulator
MARSGLVLKKRKAGERQSKILMTEEGRALLASVSTASLRTVFSSLANDQKRLLACSLRALHDRARGLLVPDMPPFIRQITRSETQEAVTGGSGGGRFSDYRVWSSLDAARFAISRLRELELARFGLTVEQASILKLLRDLSASPTVKDLEEMTLRQHHSVSTLVNRMIRMGLVSKKKKENERSHRISVTKRGRELFDTITTQAIDMAFSVLSDEEKRQLETSLRALHRRARALLGVSFRPDRPRQSMPDLLGSGKTTPG